MWSGVDAPRVFFQWFSMTPLAPYGPRLVAVLMIFIFCGESRTARSTVPWRFIL